MRGPGRDESASSELVTNKQKLEILVNTTHFPPVLSTCTLHTVVGAGKKGAY